MKAFRTLIIVLCIMVVSCESESKEKVTSDFEFNKSTFVYKKVGDVEIKADLYQIEDDIKLKPVIIWIHPGALLWGGKEDVPEEQVKFYLGKGYSVVSIDHRLAPATVLEEIITDVQDATDWVRKNGEDLLNIDKETVYLVGHSAGAYLALLAGNTMENPPSAIASFYGYGDILEDWAHTRDAHYNEMESVTSVEALKMIDASVRTNASLEERFNYYVHCRQNGEWAKVVTKLNREDDFEKLTSFSPTRNISQDFPPTLLIHGNKDTDVPFSESVKLADKFKEKGVRYKFIQMEGYGHVFDLLEGGLGNDEIRKVFEGVAAFLKEHE